LPEGFFTLLLLGTGIGRQGDSLGLRWSLLFCAQPLLLLFGLQTIYIPVLLVLFGSEAFLPEVKLLVAAFGSGFQLVDTLVYFALARSKERYGSEYAGRPVGRSHAFGSAIR
jgi:hypothetical protein